MTGYVIRVQQIRLFDFYNRTAKRADNTIRLANDQIIDT